MYKLCSTASGILGILAVALLVLGLSAVPALAEDDNPTCTYDEFGNASAGCWWCPLTFSACDGWCAIGTCRPQADDPFSPPVRCRCLRAW